MTIFDFTSAESIHSVPRNSNTKGMAAMLMYLTKDDQDSFKEHKCSGYDVKCVRSIKS